MCLFAFSTGNYVELDPLANFERLVAVGLDVRIVNEHIVTLLATYETKALLSIEELDNACSQLNILFFLRSLPIRLARLPSTRTRSAPTDKSGPNQIQSLKQL